MIGAFIFILTWMNENKNESNSLIRETKFTFRYRKFIHSSSRKKWKTNKNQKYKVPFPFEPKDTIQYISDEANKTATNISASLNHLQTFIFTCTFLSLPLPKMYFIYLYLDGEYEYVHVAFYCLPLPLSFCQFFFLLCYLCHL